MFPASAFIPESDVRSCFQLLLASNFVRYNGAVLAPFIQYFESKWVGSDFNPARFKLERLNAYVPTRAGLARANNGTVSWHSAFSERVGCSHPTFFTMAEHLKREQGLTEFIAVHTAWGSPWCWFERALGCEPSLPA